jgi:hypothetical protein
MLGFQAWSCYDGQVLGLQACALLRPTIFVRFVGFWVFWWYWGLNSGLHTGQAGAVSLEPVHLFCMFYTLSPETSILDEQE